MVHMQYRVKTLLHSNKCFDKAIKNIIHDKVKGCIRDSAHKSTAPAQMEGLINSQNVKNLCM